MSTIYQKKIETDEVDTILEEMNRFDDYAEITKSTAPFTNVLTISPEEKGAISQKKYAISQSQELGFFDDMPPALAGQMATVYRDVLYKNSINILVRLTELYPVAGRIWTNVYNVGNWTGWVCHDPSYRTILNVRHKGVVWDVFGNWNTLCYRTSGSLNEALALRDGFELIGTLPELYRPSVNYITYFLISKYMCQIRILTSGNVELGYSKDLSTGNAADIPSGLGLYTFGTLLLRR